MIFLSASFLYYIILILLINDKNILKSYMRLLLTLYLYQIINNNFNLY